MEKETKDIMTPYGQGLEQKIDPSTEWGKGIRYYTCDGKEVASMEEVMMYNNEYYKRIMDCDWRQQSPRQR